MSVPRLNLPEPTLDLSIIIVNWNTRDLLANCLQSVYDTVRGLAFEVIVVDNASTDGSAEMVRERFPQVRLIENTENVGFAKANNQAMKESSGRYVILLNSDTLVQPDALATLVAFMDDHPEAGACGPCLLNADGSLQPSCHPFLTAEREFWRLVFLDRFMRRASYPIHRWGLTRPRKVDVIKGACLALRQESLFQVGLFDERYFIYSEEMDLCYRLCQAGWCIYWVPEARVVHFGGQSTRQEADEMYIYLYRSKAQFQRKFWGERGLRRFRRLLHIAYWPRWIIASVGGTFCPSLRSRAHLFRRLLAEKFADR